MVARIQARHRRLTPAPLLALLLAVVALSVAALPDAADAALPRWRGGVDLYRPGVFSTQKTWHWCTAADVQIMRNIVHHKSKHSNAQQRRFFGYMRAHDRYSIPLRDGVDPVGWTAGLRRFVDPSYRLVSSRSFKAALRSAVRNLRLTELPVAITVAAGNHAWVLTGFTATADPATTDRFKVTSVRVTGPLWGLQSRSYGYDMRPDEKLTRKQFRRFFSPWHYAGIRMAWEGRWVSVQPIPDQGSRARSPRRTLLAKARRHHATTSLSDGHVRIAGGTWGVRECHRWARRGNMKTDPPERSVFWELWPSASVAWSVAVSSRCLEWSRSRPEVVRRWHCSRRGVSRCSRRQ